MSAPLLSIGYIQRTLSTGATEIVHFSPGVNVLVGRPNTGKTNWLQTLDFLLGDSGENPFEGAEETGLAEKYNAASVSLNLGDETITVERRWREADAKTKIFVDGKGVDPKSFQQLLMDRLHIPSLNFPKGNPMSGQTWPELSFRTLLRHLYRRQRFWTNIADQQPDGEQHACLLQFLGQAEHIFTEDFGNLVKLKLQAEQLKAHRDQYGQTLNEVTRDVLSDSGLSTDVTSATILAAQDKLSDEVDEFRKQRVALLSGALNDAIAPEMRGSVEELVGKRARALAQFAEINKNNADVTERVRQVRVYRKELSDERDRMARAQDAGAVLADLKVTHCPACDQRVANAEVADQCFLCSQAIPAEPNVDGLGSVRVNFESNRLASEYKEADELLAALLRDSRGLAERISKAEEELHRFDSELAPAREAISALAQDRVSSIDRSLGELGEKQRSIGRIQAALIVGESLTNEIAELEKKIVPLQLLVDESARATDFDAASEQLEAGMNEYLRAIERLHTGVWRHNPIRIDLTRSAITFRVGARRWSSALGGTDTLYFLMAYHYGLLSLSNNVGCHYPGLAVIDVPGEFSGEAIQDKENFIVQPFIDLLKREGYEGAQLIITGAAFTGLMGASRNELKHVHVA